MEAVDRGLEASQGLWDEPWGVGRGLSLGRVGQTERLRGRTVQQASGPQLPPMEGAPGRKSVWPSQSPMWCPCRERPQDTGHNARPQPELGPGLDLPAAWRLCTHRVVSSPRGLCSPQSRGHIIHQDFTGGRGRPMCPSWMVTFYLCL